MAGMNKVILIGRLGKDPESKSFANGGSVVQFSMATSETWRDKQSGERKERTEWHNIVIRNENVAKVAAQFLRKGDEVAIEGSIQSRKYQDASGLDRYVTEIVVGQFNGSLTLLGNGAADRKPADDHAATKRSQLGAFDDDLNDDVPF